jgi:hypothetical protein
MPELATIGGYAKVKLNGVHIFLEKVGYVAMVRDYKSGPLLYIDTVPTFLCFAAMK